MKRLLLLVLLFAISVEAKDAPLTTVLWPTDDHAIVRFTFGKFMKTGSIGSESSYMVEVTAENLWSKTMPQASFDAYFFSKDGARVGNGYISLNNLGVGEKVRFTLPFHATGAPPVSLKLLATSLPKELGPKAPEKKVRLTVYSVPSGATLKVDGQEVGVTPKQVEFALGKHTLQFSMDGFNPGSYPLELGPDDVSGGTVSYELGSLAHDTIEMRDGTTLTGDVESMDGTTVVVRAVGSLQTLDRNQVKRILLVQRKPAM